MTRSDWRSLIEAFLAGDSDADTFAEEFLEGWKSATEAKSKIPAAVEELYTAVEAFDPDADDDDAEDELRDAAEAALEELK